MDTELEIQDIVTNYISNLFTSSCLNDRLSDRECKPGHKGGNAELGTEVTLEEVKNEVFFMYAEKSHGLDCLNLVYFQIYRGIVGKDVFNSVMII